MGMPTRASSWTRGEVLALPDDGKRYELVDGELLVSPSPRGPHQAAVAELFHFLDAYVRRYRLGRVCMAPADLDFHAGQLLQPDLFIGAMVDGREPLEWDDYAVPVLVAEVLSPATARYDRVTKRRLYQRAGVGTYWIVDLDARLVEEWRPDVASPAVLDLAVEWRPDPSLPGLRIDLPELFRRVWGEQ